MFFVKHPSLVLVCINGPGLSKLLWWWLQNGDFSNSIILALFISWHCITKKHFPSSPICLFVYISLLQYGLTDTYFIQQAIIHNRLFILRLHSTVFGQWKPSWLLCPFEKKFLRASLFYSTANNVFSNPATLQVSWWCPSIVQFSFSEHKEKQPKIISPI